MGISALVNDLRRLYGAFGTYMPSRPGLLVLNSGGRDGAWSRAWESVKGAFGGGSKPKGKQAPKGKGGPPPRR